MALLETAELIDVLVQLHAASSDNKRLLMAILENDTGALRAKLESEIQQAFGTGRRLPSMKTAGIRTALRHYAKLAPMVAVVHAELDIIDVGIECMSAYGEISESARNSLDSLWEAAMKRCLELEPQDIPWGRLKRIKQSQEGYSSFSLSDELKEVEQ